MKNTPSPHRSKSKKKNSSAVSSASKVDPEKANKEGKRKNQSDNLTGQNEAIVIEDNGAKESKNRRSLRKKKQTEVEEVVEGENNITKTDFEVVIKARIVQGQKGKGKKDKSLKKEQKEKIVDPELVQDDDDDVQEGSSFDPKEQKGEKNPGRSAKKSTKHHVSKESKVSKKSQSKSKKKSERQSKNLKRSKPNNADEAQEEGQEEVSDVEQKKKSTRRSKRKAKK